MKKIIAMIITLCLTLLMLAACAAPSTASSSSTLPASSVASQPADSTTLTEPVNLRFASSGSGGSDYADIGTILNFLSSDNVLPPKSVLTQETISSGTSSAGYLIEAGMADVCRGQNAMAATVGFNGREPYKTVRALFAAGGNSITAQVLSGAFAKKTGYKGIEDIIINKYPAIICSEDVGSSDYVLLNYIFEIMGTSAQEYESWGGKIVYTNNNTASEMIQDGQADMMVACTTLTSSMITELTMTTDIIVDSFNDQIVDGLLARGFAERMIPSGTFDQFPVSKRSAYLGTSLIVSEKMDDALAYTITKALIENSDKLGESCATMRGITPKSAVDTSITVVPLHNGAIKYFREIGVLDAQGQPIA